MSLALGTYTDNSLASGLAPKKKLNEIILHTKISYALKIKIHFETKKQKNLVTHPGLQLATYCMPSKRSTILASVYINPKCAALVQLQWHWHLMLLLGHSQYQNIAPS